MRKVMNLNKYMSLDEEHRLLPDDAQALNADLAVRSPSDIPAEYRPRVADYIVDALNMGSVERQLIPSTEKLLQGLQQDS
jgi:hypothetical protein